MLSLSGGSRGMKRVYLLIFLVEGVPSFFYPLLRAYPDRVIARVSFRWDSSVFP